MSNLLSLVVEPVFRQARRISGVASESDETPGERSHAAASHSPSSQSAGRGGAAASRSPSNFNDHTEDGGFDAHRLTSTNIAVRRHFPRRPRFTRRSEEDLRSRHSFLEDPHDAPLETPAIMPSASPAAASNDRTTHGSLHGVPTDSRSHGRESVEEANLGMRSSTEPSTSTGRPNVAVVENDIHEDVTMAISLPADDGMRLLRQRIHEIRDMHASNEEKARKMHSVMTEKYIASRGHIIRPQTPSSVISQDRPFTPSSVQSQSEWDTHLTSPVSLHSTYDPENPFNILPHDLLPTYRTNELSQLASESAPLDGEEEEGEDERSFGCKHYKRNVKIQCFDCRRWYPCRHCHNEVEEHALNRRKTRHMLCMFCQTPQVAAEYCRNCSQSAAWYYCDICKLWDDDSSKKIYHCEYCGICRQGEGLGKDYFHCKVTLLPRPAWHSRTNLRTEMQRVHLY
jgi:uncharacterized CHY-type Zn-finger protein